MKKISNLELIQKLDWYHTIDLGEFITKGRYDWRLYLDDFNLKKLEGKTLIDVGAGNGYFSFEFEKRGALVTATDIFSQSKRDNHKLGVKHKRNDIKIDFSEPFNIVKKLTKSKIRRKTINIYDMNPTNIGKFDILFCNDVLLHLTDPVRALNIFSSLAKKIVIGTPISTIDQDANGKSIAEFWGATGSGAFWLPTLKCLGDMVKSAGMKVYSSKTIILAPEHAECSLPRGIIHCGKK